jgi:hypothetical protein
VSCVLTGTTVLENIDAFVRDVWNLLLFPSRLKSNIQTAK